MERVTGTAQGYLLLPEPTSRWSGAAFLEALQGWTQFTPASFQEAPGRGAERQMVLALGSYTVVLSYKPSDDISERIAPVDEGQRLANLPEDRKRKLQIAIPLYPEATHAASVYYEITADPVATAADGLPEAETIRRYVGDVLRILLVLVDTLGATAVARNAFLRHTREKDGRFFLMGRDTLAEAYYEFARERCIPLSFFGHYTVERRETHQVAGTLTHLEDWFGAPIQYARFPAVDKDLYRTLSRALYEAVACRAADTQLLFTWTDQDVYWHRGAIVWGHPEK